jgi:acetyl-CoA carboxylase biotin carboxyl carrier protein
MSDKPGSAASVKAREEIVAEKTNDIDLKKKNSAEPSLNMDELRDLANLVIEHGFTDFEFENENIRVRLSKNTVVALATPVHAATAAVPQTPSVNAAPTPAETAEAGTGLHTITSPIVGTFYRSPGPDKDPFVNEGSRVSPDTTVCIVEAMKLMNEIEAEVSGEIVEIYVENGHPVEFGQPLFGVKK